MSLKSFIKTQDLWKTEGRELSPPYLGWLNTELPLYGNTINLEVEMHT
ncbi:DUF2199 domain-containing protein [Granulicella tundricola]